MNKKYLMTAGPTPVPPEILLEMAGQIIYHRSPAFEKIFQEVREGLQLLFQTRQEVLLFTSSGTGAMEGAVVNTLSAGDRAIVVEGGKFGERFGSICRAFGVNARVLAVEWGRVIDPALVARALQEEPSTQAVFIQATETSTGALSPVREIAAVVSRYPGTILVVDAVSHLGAVDLPMDDWKLDVVVSGSQKALMLPPGLSFAALSEKAWGFVERSTLPKFYFDFKKELKNQLKNQTAYTPAISLIVGLAKSLRMIREEGLDRIFARHARLARATREAMRALGLALFAGEAGSAAVSAIVVPPGIDGQKLVRILRERHHITVAGGQDQAKGKIIRVANMGYVDKFDILTVVSAIEMALQELGHPVELGSGVAAAMKVFAEG